jgi:hypothetical protein
MAMLLGAPATSTMELKGFKSQLLIAKAPVNPSTGSALAGRAVNPKAPAMAKVAAATRWNLGIR